MRTTLKDSSLTRYWPSLVAALLTLSIPLISLVIEGRARQTSQLKIGPKNAVGEIKVEKPQGNGPSPKPVANNNLDRPIENLLIEDSDPTAAVTMDDKSVPRRASELKMRIADWRYTGYLQSSGRKIAVVQRMRFPDRRLRIMEGESIDEVKIEEISPDRILVSNSEERDEIFLDQGDPFDLSTVSIPTELSNQSEALVDLVFAQTLGRYLPESPHNSLEEDTSGNEGEALRALSESEGWLEPDYGASTEEFVERLAENLPDGLDPSGIRLTEEARNRLFGIGE